MEGGKLTLLIIALIYSQLILVVILVIVIVVVVIPIILSTIRFLFLAPISSTVPTEAISTPIPIPILISTPTTAATAATTIRSPTTALKLIITTPLRRSVEISKRIPIDLERPFSIPGIRYWRCFCAAEGAGEGLQVGDLAEEECVPGHEGLLPVRGYQGWLWGGVAEGGEGEVDEG